MQEEPSNPFNKYALAMEYYEEKPQESLSLLRSLLSTHPEYLPSYFKIAHLLWEKESWDETEDVFQNGIQLAERQKDQKSAMELKAAYRNFQFEKD